MNLILEFTYLLNNFSFSLPMWSFVIDFVFSNQFTFTNLHFHSTLQSSSLTFYEKRTPGLIYFYWAWVFLWFIDIQVRLCNANVRLCLDSPKMLILLMLPENSTLVILILNLTRFGVCNWFIVSFLIFWWFTLCEICSNTEFLLFRVFLYSD